MLRRLPKTPDTRCTAAARRSLVGSLNPVGIAPSAGTLLTVKSLAPGNRVGPYRLVEEIGAGELGSVWRVQFGPNNRVLAMKIAHAGADLDRFRSEIRVQSDLHHPSCLAVFDHGVDADLDVAFVVTEILIGRELGAVPTPIHPPDAVPIVRAIVDVVGYVVSRGYGHPNLRVKEITFDPLQHGPIHVRGFDREGHDEVGAIGRILFELLEGRGPGSDTRALTRPGCPPRLAKLVAALLEPAERRQLLDLGSVALILADPRAVALCCSNCGAELGGWLDGECSLAVARHIEHHYHRCPACRSWTVATRRIGYHGPSHERSGPLSNDSGKRCRDWIEACPDPEDHRCTCDAHARLFGGLPGKIGYHLRSVFVAPEVEVRGYDADGLLDITSFDSIVVGKTSFAEVSIRATIGGNRTYELRRRAEQWVFRPHNAWALAVVDGVECSMSGGLEQVTVRPGSRIEIYRANHADVVHVFRFESFRFDS